MVLAPRLALGLLLAGLCLSQVQGMFAPVDCCEATKDIPLALKWLSLFKGYYIQGTENGCLIRAFVLITVRNRKLCYPLNSSVTVKFKKALDDKRARMKGKTLHKRNAPSQD